MSFYQFHKTQDLPATLTDVWKFISNPANLKSITPPSMGFDIISSGVPDIMYPGMIIEYRVKPLFGIPTRWVTEITHVQKGEYFVDEQRVGPYSMWHHEHSLEEIPEGVRMKDIISYKVPFGFLGRMAHWLFISRQLEKIFAFRNQALTARFGEFSKENNVNWNGT